MVPIQLSLKFRITLIVNLFLLLILVVSTSLTIQDARRNVHDEINSSEKLALYLFEIGVLKNPILILPRPKAIFHAGHYLLYKFDIKFHLRIHNYFIYIMCIIYNSSPQFPPFKIN